MRKSGMKGGGKTGKNAAIKAEMKGGFIRRTLLYLPCLLALVCLVLAAFLLPKLMFAVQDERRCRELVMGSGKEDMDIAFFNTNYDSSLYNRLSRFAQGLGEGKQYYVTSQEMTDTKKIMDTLNSEKVFYRDSFSLLLETGLLPEIVMKYKLSTCKQYVIYGDDYAGGVNFILWYFEMNGDDGHEVKLLMDGETGEIYGVKTNTGKMREEKEWIISVYNNNPIGFMDLQGVDISEMWWVMFYYYGGMNDDNFQDILEQCGWEHIWEAWIYYEERNEAQYNAQQYGTEDEGIFIAPMEDLFKNIMENREIQVSEDGEQLKFIFPYGDYKLDFCLEMNPEAGIRYQKTTLYAFMNITAGFPEIYNLIPEFGE